MVKNPNKKLVQNIENALTRNEGFCPCSPVRDKTTICMCESMKERGECHCSLYVAVMLHTPKETDSEIKTWLLDNSIEFIEVNDSKETWIGLGGMKFHDTEEAKKTITEGLIE